MGATGFEREAQTERFGLWIGTLAVRLHHRKVVLIIAAFGLSFQSRPEFDGILVNLTRLRW
jgi:hypothetical protein